MFVMILSVVTCLFFGGGLLFLFGCLIHHHFGVEWCTSWAITAIVGVLAACWLLVLV